MRSAPCTSLSSATLFGESELDLGHAGAGGFGRFGLHRDSEQAGSCVDW